MTKRPRSITVISWLFIVFGSIALLAGLLPGRGITAAQRVVELKTHWYVHLSRMLGALSGLLMLYGFNSGRWLLVAWIVFHIIIGYMHSPMQLLMHCVIFAPILYFLFRPQASAYFRST